MERVKESCSTHIFRPQCRHSEKVLTKQHSFVELISLTMERDCVCIYGICLSTVSIRVDGTDHLSYLGGGRIYNLHHRRFIPSSEESEESTFRC